MSLPHPSPISSASYSAVELAPEHDRAFVLDQRLLPSVERYVEVRTAGEMASAIADMLVRGAPAIGIAAAYGMALAARSGVHSTVALETALEHAASQLRASRPTAVNLSWAIDRMLRVALLTTERSPRERAEILCEEALRIHREDVESCRTLGKLGAERIPAGATILTHCNAGALATGGYGTALGVIRAAHAQGKRVRVLACETRPYWQGARLTAWELSRDGIPVEVITDGMPGHFLSRRAIDVVVVGADRIAKTGDVANKIGTYGIACLAKAHEVPFYVAAPWSTVDLACASGLEIPIEERSSREVTHFRAVPLAPENVSARHPAFDVTPARLITGIVTERGIFEAREIGNTTG